MSAETDVAEYVAEASWAKLKAEYLAIDGRVLIIGPSKSSDLGYLTNSIVDLLKAEGFTPERPDRHASIQEKVADALTYPVVIALAASVGTATEVIFLLNAYNNPNTPSPLPDIKVIVPAVHAKAQFAMAFNTWRSGPPTLWEPGIDPTGQLQLVVLEIMRPVMVGRVDEKRLAEERPDRLDDNMRRLIDDEEPAVKVWGA